MTDRSGVLAAERRRLELLVASDYAGLAGLLADELVHVHANGTVDSKTSFLAAIEAQLQFIEMSRGDLEIQVHGDVAVATGPLKQTVRIKATGDVVTIDIFTTQVWQRHLGAWRLRNFQATRTAAH